MFPRVTLLAEWLLRHQSKRGNIPPEQIPGIPVRSSEFIEKMLLFRSSDDGLLFSPYREDREKSLQF